ncbi:MAG: hypothetical protein HKO88_15915 [Xanthomonadales bacterium]|nr:hypothetical protein [Xanthomonadales bacterium]
MSALRITWKPVKQAVPLLLCLALLNGCASDDVSKRQYGQHHVCHKGRTMAVTSGDLIMHQNHGDTIGPCPKEK